jgi:hypothetical protein
LQEVHSAHSRTLRGWQLPSPLQISKLAHSFQNDERDFNRKCDNLMPEWKTYWAGSFIKFKSLHTL